MENSPEPEMSLRINGAEFKATRDNTSLFTFFGRLAVYDHIFIHTGEEEDDDNVQLGAYIFSNARLFLEMVDYMVTNEYPQHVALREVAECDLKAFDRAQLGDLRESDTFPEEWADGTA